MDDIFQPVRVLLARRCPTLPVRLSEHGSSLTLGAEGGFTLDAFLHPRAKVAVRFVPGMAVEGLHYWIGIRDADKARAHFEITCSLDRLEALLAAWLDPMPPVPERLVVAPAGPGVVGPVAPLPEVERRLDPACLAGLPDPAAVWQTVQADAARIDGAALARSLPRGKRGGPLAGTRVLLGAYGPPTRKRQPCLLLTGLRAHLSLEYAENLRLDWRCAPWLWTDAPSPSVTPEMARARSLLAQGRIEEGCAPFGIGFSDAVRRLAAGQALARYERVRSDWSAELADGLRQLAPWRIGEGMARVYDYLCSANKHKPRTVERKLLLFSGQPQIRKFGLHAVLTGQGGIVLDILASGSNAWLPEPDWRDRQ